MIYCNIYLEHPKHPLQPDYLKPHEQLHLHIQRISEQNIDYSTKKEVKDPSQAVAPASDSSNGTDNQAKREMIKRVWGPNTLPSQPTLTSLEGTQKSKRTFYRGEGVWDTYRVYLLQLISLAHIHSHLTLVCGNVYYLLLTLIDYFWWRFSLHW